jgi:hypothetical protein
MRSIPRVLVIALFLLTGCGTSQKVIQHPAPSLKVDNSYFSGLGCFSDPSCLPQNLQDIEHPIDYISEPADLLGGLNPALPLAVATTHSFTPEDEIPSIYVNRCMVQQHIRYLVSIDGDIRLVDSVAGLASLYAPIDSPDEALSYAMASTGYSAVYDLHENRELKFYIDSPEETFVREVSGGFLVHLFSTYLCGCGPHIVKSVDVTVTTDGTIKLSDAVEVFSDPELDGLCID